MLIDYKRGQGSIILRIKVLNSSVATGAGLTGLTSASTGLIISTLADNEASATAYTVAGSTIESITTLGTFAAPTATKCRFKEVDSTNHKGVYEIQIADARFAVSSAKSLLISLSGATNAAETDAVIPLRDMDPYDAVRGGMSALPNVTAGANGGLPLGDASGRVDLGKILGTATATPATAGILDINVKNMNNVAATPITTIKAVQGLTTADTIATYTGNTKQTGDVFAALPANFSAFVIDSTGRVNAFLIGILTSVFTEGATGRIAAAFKQFFNIATPAATMDHGILVDTVTTYTGNTPQTGDAYARIGAAGAGLTALGDTRIAHLDADVSSRLAAAVITLTAGAVSIDAASKTGLRLSATGVGDILTTALTESYAADGAAPTVSQALFQIQQFLQERAISSTTMTVKKLDGTTTAMTFTLDSASSPTTITRTS